MEAMASVNSLDIVEDDVSTRPDSSRLSLGSSPSELSDDGHPDVDDDFTLDDVDGDGSLTPTEKIVLEEEEEEESVVVLNSVFDDDIDDDGLFEDISDTLSNAPPDIDEREVDDEVDAILALATGDDKNLEEQEQTTPVTPDKPGSVSPRSGPSSPATSVTATQPTFLSSSNEDCDHGALPPMQSKDNDNENVPPPDCPSSSQSIPNTRKRRGSSTPLDHEEWGKRRSSKLLELKHAKSAPLPEAAEDEELEDKNGENEENPGSPAVPAGSADTAVSVADTGAADPAISHRLPEEEDHPMSNGDEVAAETNGDQEYQEWHKEALDALTRIEMEFARLRDKMYDEKMSELNEEALMIAQGTHPDLVTMMATIEEKKDRRISTADAWREHKRLSCRQQLEGLEYQANIDFIAGKSALRRDILAVLNRKRWDIDHERDRLNEPMTAADRVPDPNLQSHRKREQLDEAKDLQRITHSVGFPMAPKPEALTKSLIEEDLIALGILQKPSEVTSRASSSGAVALKGHLNGEKPVRRRGPVTNNSSAAGTPAVHSAGRPHSRTRVSEMEGGYKDELIYTSQGQLHYYGRVYEKGDHFTVIDASTGRYSAKLLTTSDTEAIIQRTDGSRTRLSFIQMSRGKYQILSKHS